MKIEKVNENQICCTLTREDLEDRQIKLSELAYGSEKARGLFRDMIQQANYEFGFEANDIPLMVEAIPMSSDSIILLITKVEYPEELDTRFSKFTEPDAEEEYGMDPDSEEPVWGQQGADDILALFRKMKNTKELPKEEGSERKEPKAQPADPVKMFEFYSLEQVERLARVLNGFYKGENMLMKNEQQNRYYLVLHKSAHSPEEFNKVCNIAAEYAPQKAYTPAMEAYFREHDAVILADHALETLQQL